MYLYRCFMKSSAVLLLRTFLLVLFLLPVITGCSQKGKPKKQAKKTTAKIVKPAPDTTHRDTDTVVMRNKADSIVAEAKTYLGIRYRYGGEDTNGFDCAGFVCYVFKHHGIKLPRTADAQALLGKEIDRQHIRPGDLVFFKGSNMRSNAIGHSGIAIENKDGKVLFISATVSAGIHIDSIDGPYWKERYVKAKRIIITK